MKYSWKEVKNEGMYSMQRVEKSIFSNLQRKWKNAKW